MIAKMTFASIKAKRRIDATLQLLAVRELTSEDLGEALNMTRNAAGEYLRYLESNGLAVCVRRYESSCKGCVPSLFKLAPGVEVPGMAEPTIPDHTDCGPGSSRTVTVSKSWAPMPIPKQSIFAALGL